MSRIRSQDTGPERRVRSLLHRLGFRFSLRYRSLPGRPDVVLPARRSVVFVHGCFWHRHRACILSAMPKTHQAFWNQKFKRTIARDSANRLSLRKLGWKVITVWECELRREGSLARRLRRSITAS